MLLSLKSSFPLAVLGLTDGTTFTGTRHDCGDKAGHVIANIAVALDRPDIAPAVRAYLQQLKI